MSLFKRIDSLEYADLMKYAEGYFAREDKKVEYWKMTLFVYQYVQSGGLNMSDFTDYIVDCLVNEREANDGENA